MGIRPWLDRERGRRSLRAAGAALIALAAAGCARLPYTTQVVHEDPRVVVTLQQEVDGATYLHPVQLSAQELSLILNGFSVRQQQRLPLRWFAEEVPPKKLFRDDEIAALAGPLAVGLRKAGPHERVSFELRAPGNNPASEWDTTAGWMAVRDDLLRFQIDYVHVLTPRRRSDQYDFNYPTPRPPKGDYLLYFEPGRFWGEKAGFDRPVLQYIEFLKRAPIVPVK